MLCEMKENGKVFGEIIVIIIIIVCLCSRRKSSIVTYLLLIPCLAELSEEALG